MYYVTRFGGTTGSLKTNVGQPFGMAIFSPVPFICENSLSLCVCVVRACMWVGAQHDCVYY